MSAEADAIIIGDVEFREAGADPLRVDLLAARVLCARVPGGQETMLLLATDSVMDRLVATGAARLVRYAPAPARRLTRPEREVKKLVQLQLLDLHRVKRGDKAISQFLHRHWSEELLAAFGPPDPPGTLRRWRRERAATARDGGARSASATDQARWRQGSSFAPLRRRDVRRERWSGGSKPRHAAATARRMTFRQAD